MSKTKRFLKSIEAEQDYLGELHAKIVTTVDARCERQSLARKPFGISQSVQLAILGQAYSQIP